METPPTPNRSGLPVLAASLVAGAVGLAIAAYGLALPAALLGVHEYDDGVYFGAAVRLTEGYLPYRDYVLLHPPGIVLVTAPLALLSRAVGTDGGLAAARVLTVLVAGANCALAALAVRHRGAAASLLAGLALACFPYAVAADQTLLLEPYLVAGCLAGTVLAFVDGRLAGGRRAVAAGALFGLASAVKIWGALPVVALLGCAVAFRRRSVLPLGAGALAGFTLPCLPFFLAAPNAFVRDIVVDQLLRSPGQGGIGTVARLGELSGLSAVAGLHAGATAKLAAAIAVGALVLVTLALTGRPSACETFLAAAIALSVAAVLGSHEFYPHYAYFPVALLTPLLGACLARWCALVARAAARRRAASSVAVAPPAPVGAGADLSAPSWWRLRNMLGAIAVIAAVGWAVRSDATSTYDYVESEHPSDVAALVDAAVPRGACVVSDESIVLIAADRFAALPPGCPPALVDSFGTWLSIDPAHTPPSPGIDVPSLAAEWSRWLHTARYVVESVPTSDYIAWTPPLVRWFDAHFRLVGTTTHATVYVRARAAPGGG